MPYLARFKGVFWRRDSIGFTFVLDLIDEMIMIDYIYSVLRRISYIAAISAAIDEYKLLKDLL